MRRLSSVSGLMRLLSCCTAIVLLFSFISCASGGTSITTTTTTSTNQYATAYMAITNWGTGVTVSFPSSCTMTVSSTGVPPYHNTYYLAPAGSGQTVVATTPSGIQLAVTPYSGGISTSVNKVSATFNICPTKASTTTTAQGGAIGFISSGEVLFDPYEATQTVALADNASYTFASTTTGNGCTGTACTASFIDQCNSHPTGGASGTTWHYHGDPVCADTSSTSGASHIIGIALDGYPIYGGRDVNGNVVAASSLDACNGITSATPEFPSGAYHYVLPLNTTTVQSSIDCYAGTVGTSITAWAVQQRCQMLMAMQNNHWTPALPPLPGSIAAKNLAARAAQVKMAMAGMQIPLLPKPPAATGSVRVGMLRS